VVKDPRPDALAPELRHERQVDEMEGGLGLEQVESPGAPVAVQHHEPAMAGVAGGEAALLGDVLDPEDVLGELLVGERCHLALPGGGEDVVQEGVVGRLTGT
jgi:hypothetical protein